MIRRSLVILSSICLLSTPYAQLQASKSKPFRSEEEADAYLSEHYNQGCAYYNQKSWYRASVEFEKVIYFFPCSDEAVKSSYYLAVCFFEMKEYDFANEEFSNYLKAAQHPEFFEDAVYSKFCIAEYFKTGKRKRPFKMRYLPKWVSGQDSALAIFDEVVAAMPNNDLTIRALKSKAELLCSMQEYRDCVETYQLIIRRFPKNEIVPDCYLNIGEAYLQQSRYEYQNPDILALAELNLRKFKDEFPRDERVKQVKQTVFQIKELYAKGLCDLGLFYERMGKPEASAIYFQSSIEEFPDTKVASFCRDRLKSLGYPKEESTAPTATGEVKTNDQSDSISNQEPVPKEGAALPMLEENKSKDRDKNVNLQKPAVKEEAAPVVNHEPLKPPAGMQSTNDQKESFEETQWTTGEIVQPKRAVYHEDQDAAEGPSAHIKHTGAASWIAEQITPSEQTVNQQGLEAHSKFANDPTHPFEETTWLEERNVHAEQRVNPASQATQSKKVSAQVDAIAETPWTTEEIVPHKRPAYLDIQEAEAALPSVQIKHTGAESWIAEQITQPEQPDNQHRLDAHRKFANDPTHTFEETSWISHEVVQAERPAAQPIQEVPAIGDQIAEAELPSSQPKVQAVEPTALSVSENPEDYFVWGDDQSVLLEETPWKAPESVQTKPPSIEPKEEHPIPLAAVQTQVEEVKQEEKEEIALADLPVNKPQPITEGPLNKAESTKPEDDSRSVSRQSTPFEETQWETDHKIKTEQPTPLPEGEKRDPIAVEHIQISEEMPAESEPIYSSVQPIRQPISEAPEDRITVADRSETFEETPWSTDPIVQAEQPTHPQIEQIETQLADEVQPMDASEQAGGQVALTEVTEYTSPEREENVQLANEQTEPETYDQWTNDQSMQSAMPASEISSPSSDDIQAANEPTQWEDNTTSKADAVTQYYMHYSLMKRQRRVRE